LFRAVVVVAVLAACGGDNTDPCGFHERDDLANATAPEATGRTLGNGVLTVCGAIDGGHFDVAASTVDVDSFAFATGGDGDRQLEIQLASEPDAALLSEVAVRLFTDAANPRLLAQGTLRLDLADHAAFLATVPAGDLDLVVTARSSGAIDGSLPYRVRIVSNPAVRCAAATGPVQYREAGDGSDDTGNDVVSVDLTRATPFASDGGTPEPTELAIKGGLAYHLAGTSGAAAHASDAYLDRDTYELRAGPSSNELGVRLDWPGGADLDYIVFEPGTMTPVATSTRSGTTGPELQVFAVRPGATYWLWVGRFGGPGDNGAPVSYDVALCAGAFY
jgi:hypothetical protein